MAMVFCVGCGKEIHESATFCPQCGAPQPGAVQPGAVQPGAVQPGAAANAGQPIPDGIKGWSWGAFLLNWIWAIGNKTWIGLLAIIPYVGFIMAIVLGIKGREWAWKNKQWESVEHFNRVQRTWSMWGLILTFGVGGLGILAAIAIPAYFDYQAKATSAEIQAALRNGVTLLIASSDETPDGPSEATLAKVVSQIKEGSKHILEAEAYSDNNGYLDVSAKVEIGKHTGTYVWNVEQGNCVAAIDLPEKYAGSCPQVAGYTRPPRMPTRAERASNILGTFKNLTTIIIASSGSSVSDANEMIRQGVGMSNSLVNISNSNNGTFRFMPTDKAFSHMVATITPTLNDGAVTWHCETSAQELAEICAAIE